MRKKYLHYPLKIITLILSLSLSPASANSNSQKNILTFGIVPQQSPMQLARNWLPVIKQLNITTGLRIEFKTAKDIPTFEKRLANNEYDIAYMNPYHYVHFHSKNSYQAIAKEKKRKIQGIIVVRKDSVIKDIKDLHNQSLAFPAPAAFAATLLPIASLKGQGIKVVPHYVSSHDSVYKSVAHGIYIAGGGINRTLNSLDRHEKDKLRVLWRTKKHTPHAIAVNGKMNLSTQKLLQKAFVDISTLPNEMNILKLLNIKAFEKAKNNDWDDIRTLNIKILEEQY